jgi:pimeloyl-ACP methyl ester carboxylesterase
MTYTKCALLQHLFLVGITALSTAWAQNLAGAWRGNTELPEAPLAIGITLVDDADGLVGTIDIPAQGIDDLPLTDVTCSGSSLSFGLQGVPGAPVFDGTVAETDEAARITGDFTQSGQTFAFTLTRGAVAAAVQPQEPQPPFPYRSEAVQFQNGEITLAGTLTLPEGEGPFAAVLLITGSGPQDRDETIAGHKPFLLFADTLTRAGYATLRVDDRGVGGSSGDLSRATYDDLTGDVLAGVASLRAHAAIDRERIGLFGHSEGGYLAPLAAGRSADVVFVIMMAGPAVSGEAVLLLQNRLIYEGLELPKAQVAYIRQLSTPLEQKTMEPPGFFRANVLRRSTPPCLRVSAPVPPSRKLP